MNDTETRNEPAPKIKVTDRRLFDSEGNLREDEPPPPEPVAVADIEDSSTSDDGAVTEPPIAPTEPVAAVAEAETTPATNPEPAPAVKLDEEALMRFIEEQYIGGLMALGAMPDPQSGQTVEDLGLAQVRIEVLGLLRDRAAESLSAEAKKGVDDVIYQLRMAFLQKSKVAQL
jgi:hypothetical protein